MPIDPSIYSQLQPGPQIDMWSGLARAQQMQAGQQQLALQRQSADVLNEQRQTATEDRRLKIAAAERETREEQALRTLFASDKPINPGQVYSVVGPERGATILKGISALQEQNQKTFKSTQELIGTIIPAVKALPEGMRPDGYALARKALIDRGVAKPEDVPETYAPEFLDQALRWAMTPEQQFKASQPDLMNVSPGQSVIDKNAPGKGPVYTAPAKVDEPTIGTFGDYLTTYARDVAKKPVQALTAAEKETAKRKWEALNDNTAPKYEWATDPKTGKTALMTPDEIRKSGAQQPSRAITDSSLPPQYQTALDRAIMSIPANRRGSVAQTASRLWAEGNVGELKAVIRQAATEGEDVTTKNQIRSRQATIDALADAKTMLDEMKAAGVDPGWLTGTAEDLARKLGTSTDPKLVAFKNRLLDTLINYRRAATGAAFGVKEGADYERMFPNYAQNFPVNAAAIEGLTRAMKGNDRTYWENKLGKDGAALVGAIAAGSVVVTDPQGGTHTFPDQQSADQFKRAAGIP